MEKITEEGLLQTEKDAEELGFEVTTKKRSKKYMDVNYVKSNLICSVKQILTYPELQLTELMFSYLKQAALLHKDRWHRISIQETAEALDIDYESARNLWQKNYENLAKIVHHVRAECLVTNMIEKVQYHQDYIEFRLTESGCELLSGTKESDSLLRAKGYIQKPKTILKSAGKYTHQLFDLLESSTYATADCQFYIQEFKDLLQIPISYSSCGNIAKAIIIPTLAEIAKKTNKRYNWEWIRPKKRNISGIRFWLETESTKEQQQSPLIPDSTIRREFLSKNMPVCPDCTTRQVQLIDYRNKPAKWKCRHCQKVFTFEPEIEEELNL